MQIEILGQPDEYAGVRFVTDMLVQDWLMATDWQSTYITLDMLREDAERAIIGQTYIVPTGDEHGTRCMAYIGLVAFSAAWERAVAQWQDRAA